MKFLVDAQIPMRLVRVLGDAGHDAVHTSQLAGGNRTSDGDIARIADRDDRVVVSKDRDFRDSHLLRGTPRRLLVVATGNISNDALASLLDAYLPMIVAAFDRATMVELRANALVIHDVGN